MNKKVPIHFRIKDRRNPMRFREACKNWNVGETLSPNRDKVTCQNCLIEMGKANG